VFELPGALADSLPPLGQRISLAIDRDGIAVLSAG
jgi:hypothetical protein